MPITLESVEKVIDEKMAGLSLEEVKLLSPQKLKTSKESRQFFFNIVKEVVSEISKTDDPKKLLEILDTLSFDMSASAFAKEIQQGTDEPKNIDDDETDDEVAI